MASTILKTICPFPGLNSFFCILSLGFLFGCTKEEVEPYPTIPEIRLVALSHDTIRQYEDVLVIRIMYKDGEGDIGFENPEEYALQIRDIRLAEFDEFYVGPLAPPDAIVPIQGELTIEFPSLFLFGNGSTELTKFQIKLFDRAGHESNLLETDFVAIVRK